MSLSSEHC